jgi:methyl-accepting chemotaxis protein
MPAFDKRALIPTLSVRTRIIAIAVIPVVGFLANGIAFTSGEAEVDSAFRMVRKATVLSNAGHDLKAAFATMRISMRDFVAKPNHDLVLTFKSSHELATKSLDIIEGSLNETERKNLAHLRARIVPFAPVFEELVKEQEKLGFTENSGIRLKIRDSAAAVERFLNADIATDMSWLRESDASKLLASLLIMRRYEADYRLTGREYLKNLFGNEFQKFTKTFAAINAPPATKEQLNREIQSYVDTFNAWAAIMNKIEPTVATLDLETEYILPAADSIIQSVKVSEAASAAALTRSQDRTRGIIIWVGCAAVFFGACVSWLIGRSVTRPINGLAAVMKRLADGDTSARIPATNKDDELGAMAPTVIVSRDTMIERERLAATQVDTNRARELRSEIIAGTIVRFEQSVDEALAKLRGAAGRLESTSGQLNSAADAVSAEARLAEERVGDAAGNVTAAANSVEELAASIAEIATQATKSTDVASRAVCEAERTAKTMTELGTAATRIGEVVGLIQAIAGQTNLLALNATIEAARAGEAGRGFAVVASEVKSLAVQTAKATEEIISHIAAVQTSTEGAVDAIRRIADRMQQINEYTSDVAASVEEQNAATGAISQNVASAAEGTKVIVGVLGQVAGSATGGRASAQTMLAASEVMEDAAGKLRLEVESFLAKVAS